VNLWLYTVRLCVNLSHVLQRLHSTPLIRSQTTPDIPEASDLMNWRLFRIYPHWLVLLSWPQNSRQQRQQLWQPHDDIVIIGIVSGHGVEINRYNVLIKLFSVYCLFQRFNSRILCVIFLQCLSSNDSEKCHRIRVPHDSNSYVKF